MAYGLMGLTPLPTTEDDKQATNHLIKTHDPTTSQSAREKALQLLTDYHNGAIALAVILGALVLLLAWKTRHALTRMVSRLGGLAGRATSSSKSHGVGASHHTRAVSAARDVELEEGLSRPLFDRDDNADAFSLHDDDEDDDQDDRARR